jgi:hypothetical protein
VISVQCSVCPRRKKAHCGAEKGDSRWVGMTSLSGFSLLDHVTLGCPNFRQESRHEIQFNGCPIF